jgi:transcriptional regulator with XRE-family HTH domain
MTVKQSADKSAAKKPRARSAPVADRGSRAVVSAIGSEVRRLRKRLELTANELARRAGLSVAMLSRIETGHAAPSLPSLAAIAGGLGVPMARLFATHDKVRDCCFVPAGQGLRVERRGSRFGHLYNILGKSLSGPAFMEPYLITLDGASQMNTGFQHPEAGRFPHVRRQRHTWSGRTAIRSGDMPVGHGSHPGLTNCMTLKYFACC